MDQPFEMIQLVGSSSAAASTSGQAVLSAIKLAGHTLLGDDMGDLVTGVMKAAFALALVLVAVGVSFWQELGLEKDMLVSIARAFGQLTIIGFVLNFIFSQEGTAGTICIFLAFCFMVTIAGYTAGNRAKGVPHARLISGVAIFGSCVFCMLLLVVLSVFPATPRYLIPVSGMMVGNAMTVTGVALKRLREDLRQQVALVEAALALGATPRQAIHKNVKRSLTLALAPVLDNAKTVGLISLPGAMTGLIMGGASPFEASGLQIVVMNFLIGASTLSSVGAVVLAWTRFFTPTYQIRDDILLAE